MIRRLAPLLALALLGCSTVATAPDTTDWHPVPLPGKEHTRYEPAQKEGRLAVRATSEASASMWRKRVDVAPALLGEVSFSWWVADLVPGADVAEAGLTDAPARVMFGFGGDVSRLSLRTRVQFELAQALTGEAPPYATLVYVWDARAPVGTVVHNPRSDRVRKIVVDSGPAELRRWRDHRRNLREDFRRAFGEDPGPLVSIALMTDSDNTRSAASSWYGGVTLHPAAAARQP